MNNEREMITMNFDNGQQDYNRHYTSQVWGGVAIYWQSIISKVSDADSEVSQRLRPIS